MVINRAAAGAGNFAQNRLNRTGSVEPRQAVGVNQLIASCYSAARGREARYKNSKRCSSRFLSVNQRAQR